MARQLQHEKLDLHATENKSIIPKSIKPVSSLALMHQNTSGRVLIWLGLCESHKETTASKRWQCAPGILRVTGKLQNSVCLHVPANTHEEEEEVAEAPAKKLRCSKHKRKQITDLDPSPGPSNMMLAPSLDLAGKIDQPKLQARLLSP